MNSKKKTNKKELKKNPRHRIHAVDKHYYSIWLNLELMAKLRILSEKQNRPISDIIVEKMNELVTGIKLTKEAKEWMALRLSLNEKRKA